MSIVVSDLVANIRAVGVQETQAAVKAVGVEAAQTARALELMAAQFAKLHGGTAAEALNMFQRTGVQPTAAALEQAARAAEKTGAAVQAAVPHTQAAAKAAEEVSKGWTSSESSVIRFASALVGVNLGISLVAGAARLLHDAVMDTASAQLQWEQSLVRSTALYGRLASTAVAVSQAQAQAPGMIGSQQEFLSANLNAAYLSTRYGLAPRTIFGLTSAAGAAAYGLGMNRAEAADLQARALAFAEGGGSSLRGITGTEGDPLSIARRIGGVSGAQLQALTPQQLKEIQTEAGIIDLRQTALAGDANQRGLIQLQNEKERALAQAQGAVQNSLEGIGGAFGPAPVPERRLLPGLSLLPAGTEPLGSAFGVNRLEPPSVLTNAVREAQKAFEDASKAVTDNATALADHKAALERLGVTYNTAAFRLLGFTGNIEDVSSIARGDIGAGAQGAVAARARSAVPVQGMGTAEIGAIAQNTSWQQVFQNFVAQQAQGQRDNAIREWLQGQGPSGAIAIRQGQQLEPINRGIGQATTRGEQIDKQTAETQAGLERIALTQRERYVQLLRDTVDLRRLDIQQQQVGIQATQAVIQATRAGLPAQYALSDAQYTTNRAAILAQARLARTLQGKDVSGLPSIEELIQMNVQGQFAQAEAGPAALEAGRAVELAQRPATAAGLAQSLTQGQLQNAQLTADLKNLGDLPEQTALELELVQNNRDQLSVQTELREYMKQLVYIMSQRPPQNVPADQGDRGAPASSQLAGARR